MTSLNTPELGTDPVKGWAVHPVHLAATYVTDEYFLALRYKSSISNAEWHGKELEHRINEFEKKSGLFPHKEMAISNAYDLSNWALQMKQEKYHKIFTHAFIGMWAAFEAGIENTTAIIIQRDKLSATECAKQFKAGRYPIEQWPFSPEICMEIAQKLETRAKEQTQNGGVDIFGRIKTMLSWMGLEIVAEDKLINNLAEANKIRNTVLHRYGVISQNDAKDIPNLNPYIDNVMPIEEDKFFAYYEAIHGTLIAIAKGIFNSRFSSKDNST
jgi:hypothetical protein